MFPAKIAEFIDRNLPATEYYLNEEMKKHTTFKTGGPADILILPYTISDLQKLMHFLVQAQIPYIIIGHGSNLLVGDKGVREPVIKLEKNLSNCAVAGEVIEAEAGALIMDVAKLAQKQALTGLEFACGIPGTVGGAVFMNAGAYGGEIKDVLEEVLVLTTGGNLQTRTVSELNLGYRTSVIQKNGDLIVKAKFRLQKGDQAAIQNRMNELTRKREANQPLNFPSAGSIFKRPAGHYTGQLIQEASLKGYKIGGAQVSDKHAGFIVNTGNATSSDIINLIRHIQAEVKKRFHVQLETEVRMIGEF
ncbi:MAG: UDP-N-acetylmuramate dehydrogenase [Firmicutes bacterium]|nr:UDP-N-acetylmuramate dehydrogenase [Bacillota bacterium]